MTSLQVRNIIKSLNKHFEVKDLGESSRFLGYRIRRDQNLLELTLDQEPYIPEVIYRFNIDQEAETLRVYRLHLAGEDSKEPAGEECRRRTVVGALTWAFVMTRTEISDAVRALARYCKDPGRAHLKAVQIIMQHLLATRGRGITYDGDGANSDMLTYPDSDNADDRHKVFGF
ncbi:unnamed protein product, partial [Discosporangium mesarthrocarpum]